MEYQLLKKWQKSQWVKFLNIKKIILGKFALGF
jgi:hypothetical protein